LLHAAELRKDYGDPENPVRALRGLELRVDRGDYLAVMGPSGSGKSTLLHLLGLLHRPSGGLLEVFGHDYRDLDRREMARLRNREIGFVFQDSLLIPSLTVLENAALPLVYAAVPKPERLRRARVIVEDLGLGHRCDHRASALSGGESQRTAVARALINEPDLVLADEPTGNLDQENGAHIMEILDGLHREGRVITIVDGRIADESSRGTRATGAGRAGPPASDS